LSGYGRIAVLPVLVALACRASYAQKTNAPTHEWIRVSDDGLHFVRAHSGKRFIVWGVNYDHDRDGRLLEDYWHDEWPTVVEDFGEIKRLRANTVRVHLQLGKFMIAADRPNETNLARLADLVKLAEQTGLHLNITGLGCYHKNDVPPWYDKLSEAERWKVQRRFWQTVAKICHSSPNVFCYDLMNEPILPGEQPEVDWLADDFAGKHFVQRISLDLAGRTRIEVAKAWVHQLSSAIREVDDRHLITVGVIPWEYVFENAKPLFYSPQVGEQLDFVSVHFYPKKGDATGALAALRVYEVGKPLVVEEIFPLKCSVDEAAQFIDGSRSYADGWISFYWGQTIEEYRHRKEPKQEVMAKWLEYFRSQGE
jgi:hypothetical protein